MLLYTCGGKKTAGSLGHPCGAAAKALDEAGHVYEIKTVRGYVGVPWTWPSRKRDRAEVRELSGQNGVPILLLDDGTVIAGSGEIKAWAAQTPTGPVPPGQTSE